MTLKQLKKELQVGRELTVQFLLNCPPSRVGKRPRRVVKVQGNAIAFRTENSAESWLQWPKASEIIEIPGGFELLDVDYTKPGEPLVPHIRYLFEPVSNSSYALLEVQ